MQKSKKFDQYSTHEPLESVPMSSKQYKKQKTANKPSQKMPPQFIEEPLATPPSYTSMQPSYILAEPPQYEFDNSANYYYQTSVIYANPNLNPNPNPNPQTSQYIMPLSNDEQLHHQQQLTTLTSMQPLSSSSSSENMMMIGAAAAAAAAVSQSQASGNEKTRMISINEAFEILRFHIPTFPYERRLSKIDTLHLAISYISLLESVIESNLTLYDYLKAYLDGTLVFSNQAVSVYGGGRQSASRPPSWATSGIKFYSI